MIRTVGKYSSASIFSTESKSPVRLGSDKNVHQWLEKHLYYIPSSSWLNLVERWFGEITCKQIRRGVFKSVPKLIEAIQELVRINNRNLKTFVWIKTVGQILEKVGHCKAATETPH